MKQLDEDTVSLEYDQEFDYNALHQSLSQSSHHSKTSPTSQNTRENNINQTLQELKIQTRQGRKFQKTQSFVW